MNYSFSEPARSMSLFVLAGLCEIGGGWLIWQWLVGTDWWRRVDALRRGFQRFSLPTLGGCMPSTVGPSSSCRCFGAGG